jgi:hypothetical protein
MSAQGSGVRLTATTVPDDQSRPADTTTLLDDPSNQVRCRGPWALDRRVPVPLHPIGCTNVRRHGPPRVALKARASLNPG